MHGVQQTCDAFESDENNKTEWNFVLESVLDEELHLGDVKASH